MSIDRTIANTIIVEIRELMRTLAKSHNLTLGRISGSFQDTELSVKVNFNDTNVEGETQGESDFKLHAVADGLSIDDLHKKFFFRGMEYEIMGYAPRRYRFPIECKNARGKTFFFTSTNVKVYLHIGELN